MKVNEDKKMETYFKSCTSHIPTRTLLIVFLLFMTFGIQYSMSINCYACIWMSHTTGVVSDEKVDNCRPGKFHVNHIMVESCPNGCVTNVLHQNDPEQERSRTPIQQWSNCTENSVLMNMKDMNMTMYKRKCADKQVNRDYCEVTYMSGFREEKRYCHADYCNGETGAATHLMANSFNVAQQLMFIFISVACPFLFVMPGRNQYSKL